VDPATEAVFLKLWADFTTHDTLPRDPAVHTLMYQMAKKFFTAGWAVGKSRTP
jgi:hypothetical protein